MTSIGKSAFNYCTGLTFISIPEGVTTIGESAFYGCTGLTSISIPENVTSIGKSAFYNCTGLTSISIPESVTSIGERAFEGCIGELIINCDVPQFGGSFSKSLFVSVTVNGNNIGSRAFSGCSSIRDLNLGENVTSIAGGAFNGCSGLETIQVNEGNKIFDSRNNCNAIFEGDTLILGCKNTLIPEDITSFGSYAFNGCTGLTSITIPESVKSIGESAFYGCTGLTSITIPESVKEIKSGAFNYCSQIQTVNALSAIPPTITEDGGSAFSVYSTAFLYVPLGCEEAYGTAAGWKKFAKIREKDFGTKDCLLTIKGLNGGSIALKCKTRSAYSFLITSEEGWGVSSVTFNGSDVTADVADDGTYTTPSLTGNSELSVVFEKSGSAVKEVMTDNPLYVSAGNGAVYISNADRTLKATVYTADGKQVKQAAVPAGATRIPLSEGQLYIIKVGDRTFKVTM